MKLEVTFLVKKQRELKENIYNFLKEKNTLTDIEKIVLKNADKYLKKLNNDLKKLQEYQDNITYDLDYLFNEHPPPGSK